MLSLKPYSSRCNLEGRVALSNIFKPRPCFARTARKTIVKPQAAYMPNFGPMPSDSDSPLHGVLHSTKLPPTLAGKTLKDPCRVLETDSPAYMQTYVFNSNKSLPCPRWHCQYTCQEAERPYHKKIKPLFSPLFLQIALIFMTHVMPLKRVEVFEMKRRKNAMQFSVSTWMQMFGMTLFSN